MYRVSFIYNGEFYKEELTLIELNAIEHEALVMGDRLVIVSMVKI